MSANTIFPKIYHGETPCMGVKKDHKAYANVAYYVENGKYFCGVHSNKSKRKDLPHNPNKGAIDAKNLVDHNKSVDQALINVNLSQKGSVILFKMQMMKNPGIIKGYLNIFPNFKHGNRKDGLGLPSLSPKRIGPVKHGQPGLPDAQNLENLHQGNKVFPDEVDASECQQKNFMIQG